MKKILSIVVLSMMAIAIHAQKEVTKFLGIPVDGSKSEMIQKLKAKGFEYNSSLECLEGEFNGRQVQVSVVTNNNKVWRIVIVDAVASSEGSIKIRFNHLCQQFSKNKKYISASSSDYTLSDSEKISYEMVVNNKRYEAAYFQLPSEIDPTASKDDIYEDSANRSVWFMIAEQYGEYYIVMYYDNEYNHSDGEDL